MRLIPIQKNIKVLSTFLKVSILPLLLFCTIYTSTAQVVISEIFPNGTFELKNNGNSTTDLSSYWICTFPSYTQLSNLGLECGSLNLASGETVVLSGFNNYNTDDSELGLYNTNSFSSADAIVSYVDWGAADNQRASVAVSAGIWTQGEGAPSFNATSSLVYDGEGITADDWEVNDNPMICPADMPATCMASGGTLTGGPFSFCVDGMADNLPEGAISLAGAEGETSQWVVTDDQGMILGLPPSFTAPNFDDAGTGACIVYNVSYDDIMGLAAGENVNNLSGCFGISNGIVVTRVSEGAPCPPAACMASGGTLTGGPFSFCVDGMADNLSEGAITLTGASAANSQWVVTDDQGMILGLPPSFTAPNFDDAGTGACIVYNVSFDDIVGLAAGENVSNLSGCFGISNGVVVNRVSEGGPCDPATPVGCMANGGILSGGPFSFCVDGNPDNIPAGAISLTGASAANSQWVVTDELGKILGLPPSFTAPNFDDAGTGTCLVYNVSFDNGLTGLAAGNNISELEGCFDLSNGIAVDRTNNGAACMTGVTAGAGRFFVSSNNQQAVGVYSVQDDGSVMANTFRNVASDADGIHYEASQDVLYQLNRSNGSINAYSNVNTSLMNGTVPNLTASSSADSKNGREIAYTGGRIVVAQDANDANNQENKFFVYDASPTSITLSKTYDVDFNLWGIHAAGETLYAIEDNSNRVAIFNNFFSPASGTISPSQIVSVAGLIRTHGITYVAARDMMILTDVGAASSATDGAFIVIRGFTAASADGFISIDEQVRIGGPISLLGNPVDVAFDSANDMIYIAERANGGGRVLGFANPTVSRDAAPTYNAEFAGASGIYFPGESTTAGPMLETSAQLFASSNNQQMVGVYNILENRSIAAMGFSNVAGDADGIYFDSSSDILYQVNRMNGSVVSYGSVNANLSNGARPQYLTSSTSDFSNGRELAESNGRLVVAQDANDANGQRNRLVVYTASNGNITFDRTVDVGINLWGIHAEGETLYAIVDNSNELAIFDNFFAQSGNVTPSRTIEVDGLVRTHGLTYVASRDMMILTDIGAASSATDGAFLVIRNFTAASADGTITMAEQVRIGGSNTFLGNPVDIAFDEGTDMVFIAERANDGGRILGFVVPTVSGNVTPIYNNAFAGVSAVYLSSDGGGMGAFAATEAFKMQVGSVDRTVITPIQPELSTVEQHGFVKVFPNPASDLLTLEILSTFANQSKIQEATIIDNYGRRIRNLNLNSEVQTVDISDLAAGIYHLSVLTDTQKSTVKFLVVRNR